MQGTSMIYREETLCFANAMHVNLSIHDILSEGLGYIHESLIQM